MAQRMLKILATGVSWVFHPVFVIIYLTAIFLYANPYIFTEPKSKYFVFVGIYTIVFPLVSVLLLRGTGLLKDLNMPDHKDRIAPYIMSIIFVMWFFINTLSNPDYPSEFNTLLLGGLLAMIFCFFVNIWDKISMHTCAITLLTVSAFIISERYSDGRLEIYFPSREVLWSLSMTFVALFFVLMTFLVMVSRVYLGAHTRNQVLGGMMVGIFSPILALRLIEYVQ